MANLFYGLNIARNALRAQNAVLNVTAHNIANASTPGYSRQTMLLSSISYESHSGLRTSPTISIGGGVEAVEIARSRFALYDEIFRKGNQDLNDYVKTEELMHQVELLFDEPTDRGLSSVLNEFFNGWHEVANDPQNMAARQSLKSFAQELASRLQRIYRQLQGMGEDIYLEIEAIPESINEMTAEIADLNVAISVVESQKASANDLRDKRDYLIDKLSELVDVRAIEQKNGTYTVIIGSKVVVERDNYSKLYAIEEIPEGESMKKTIITSDEGIEYVPQYGRLGALIRFRDSTLGGLREQLDVFAGSIVNAVNYEHRYGYGLDGESGRDFFDPNGTKAFNISISREISDVTHIAVSGDGSVGDNTNALRINDIKNSRVVEQRFTLFEYYNAMIANIGIIGREARSGRVNEELLVSQIDNAREGIKGVSIDEEFIRMIECQRIYQSAARLIVVIDELLQDIIRLK